MKDFSHSTKVYILSTIIVAIIFASWQFYQTPPVGSWLLLLACTAASILQGIAVFGTTARSTYSLSWIIYAFILLLFGPSEVLIVVIISHVAEWLLDRDRLKWYIQTFNISKFLISFTLIGLLISQGETLFPASPLIYFLINMVALAAFTLLDHYLVGWVLKLARGQNLSQSGVFGRFTLFLDFTLLCLGYVAAIIWQANPFSLVLVGFIAFLLYQALNIPALERKTEIDPKTELFNARYFTEELDDEMVRAKRFKRPLSLIMADLDLLRNINNTYGHLAGDVVLQGIARILQEMTREYDVVARFGGEEFAIMLPETNLEDAHVVAERIRQRIEEAEFVVSTSVHPIRATMSLGIAGLQDSKQTTDNLIHNADIALYRAKETGRNRTCLHDKQLDTELNKSREWAKFGISVKEVPISVSNPHFNGQLQESVDNMPAPESFPEPATIPPTISVATPLPSKPPAQKHTYPAWVTTAYISIIASTSLILAFFLISTDDIMVDWTGLLFFTIVALLMETASIEVHVRETTVSTSATLLVAGVLLFGATGVILLSVIISFIAYAKRRTPISRFIFNVSNHTIGGFLIAGFISLSNQSVDKLSMIQLLILGAFAAMVIFLSTTMFLTVAIALSEGSCPKAIWKERFRWLSSYYLVLGVIAAALVFAYNAISWSGILIVVLPLLLMRYSQKQYLDHTEIFVQDLQKTNAQLLQKSEEVTLLNEELLLTLARSLDLRDPHVLEHSKHVSRYAVCIAQEMQLPKEQIQNIRKAGLLHDIGKLGVREEILFKPGRLTADEFEIVKEHTTIGAELVQGCHSLEILVPFVLHHHEFFNGQGYPIGLAGEEIPLEARILSVADAVEAMASDRPYKKAMSPIDILAEVQRCAGTQFDPSITEAFAQVITRHGESVIVNSARNVSARQTPTSKTYAPHY